MSKELFNQMREDEVYAFCSMEWNQMLYLLDRGFEVTLHKPYKPKQIERFKKDPEWIKINNEIKRLKQVKRDIEFIIENGKTTDQYNTDDSEISRFEG